MVYCLEYLCKIRGIKSDEYSQAYFRGCPLTPEEGLRILNPYNNQLYSSDKIYDQDPLAFPKVSLKPLKKYDANI